MSTISINPTFGGITWWAHRPLSPRANRVRSGDSADHRTGDLVATTPKTLTEWTSIWRAHPVAPC